MYVDELEPLGLTLHGIGEHSGRYEHVGRGLADAGIEFDRRYVKHGPHVRTAARQLAVELIRAYDRETARVEAARASRGQESGAPNGARDRDESGGDPA